MKTYKMISLAAAAILLSGLCISCGSSSGKKTENEAEKEIYFTDEASMKAFAENVVWIGEETEEADENEDSYLHYKIYVFDDTNCLWFDLARPSDTTLEEMLENMFAELESKGEPTSFDSAVDFITTLPEVQGFTCGSYDIVYFPEEYAIKTVDNSFTWHIIEDKMKDDLGNIYSSSQELTDLEAAFDTIKENEKNAFLEKYQDLPTYIDVKYDPFGHVGDEFILTGRAELDDYYNYDYRDRESIYFCMCVTPEGGGYTDRWYIYCYRSNYKDLFEKLKDGAIQDITLICWSGFPDSLEEEMADLHDYYIN